MVPCYLVAAVPQGAQNSNCLASLCRSTRLFAALMSSSLVLKWLSAVSDPSMKGASSGAKSITILLMA